MRERIRMGFAVSCLLGDRRALACGLNRALEVTEHPVRLGEGADDTPCSCHLSARPQKLDRTFVRSTRELEIAYTMRRSALYPVGATELAQLAVFFEHSDARRDCLEGLRRTPTYIRHECDAHDHPPAQSRIPLGRDRETVLEPMAAFLGRPRDAPELVERGAQLEQLIAASGCRREGEDGA